MFTGIIEEIGIVRKIVRSEKSIQFTIVAFKVCEGTKVGDSIAVNGVCLTVTFVAKDVFCADVMPETLLRSSLGKLRIGSRVNLERAILANGRFGGHFVSGHIDGKGILKSIEKDGIAFKLKISCNSEFLKYIPVKASVALDGISLTVCAVDSLSFTVSIIPHTFSATTLLDKSIGDEINIECDMVAKYLEKLK